MDPDKMNDRETAKHAKDKIIDYFYTLREHERLINDAVNRYRDGLPEVREQPATSSHVKHNRVLTWLKKCFKKMNKG
jgi:hypothetical protein